MKKFQFVIAVLLVGILGACTTPHADYVDERLGLKEACLLFLCEEKRPTVKVSKDKFSIIMLSFNKTKINTEKVETNSFVNGFKLYLSSYKPIKNKEVIKNIKENNSLFPEKNKIFSSGNLKINTSINNIIFANKKIPPVTGIFFK